MLISVRDLEKTFASSAGPVQAGAGVSFDLAAGETVGLVGESGCGKSTVGRCILRLLEPTSGTIAFDGQPIESLSQRRLRPLRQRMQLVFQDPVGSMNPAFTVRATLADALRTRRLDRAGQERVMRELLEAVGLDERYLERRRTGLSGGQLQRVAIARALAPEPDFVFLDEPTSALDVSVRGQIVNLLADLQRDRGLAYLFASHDLGVVRFLADRVVVMYRGQVVESGPAEQILTEPTQEYTKELVAAARLHDGDVSPVTHSADTAAVPPHRSTTP
jgi:peptide/nickel transport system ATP-binding protein